ncbi:BT1 folate/biopterin transporter family protein [Theileria equi strain WA]|uniref:BT1 folate/biopterin transporter family protein n=1 Tax=Theileria equi strain WA TaxID=1537102 RepID=L1LA90_THEEQ|nr:BT1 folate/biopterin transporter family protein [Theileria equi strain WA]EKX72367.1 BT1 folate/biopterin transporter family protein [Theileria equi strain WA]|eukprot:XP_004831819.1 BT1 folate/biopterin transporter family protein [Theileria equi strain WA]
MAVDFEDDTLLFSNHKLLEEEQESLFSRICRLDESLLYSTGYFTVRNDVISCLISTVNIVDLVSSLPIMYIYKNEFNLSPAMLIFVSGITRLPLNIKMLFAFMSDSFPIFGSRRKNYLAIGSFTVLSSMLMIGIPEKQGIIATTFFLTSYALGVTLCNVVGEALVVESGRNQSNDQFTRYTSASITFTKFLFSTMLYLGGLLMMVVSARKVFLIASVVPTMVFLISPLIQEREIATSPNVQNQWSRLVTFACVPEIRKPAFFFFITAVAPDPGLAMFYFMTEKLHFKSELLGRIWAIQSLAGLVGIYSYSVFFRGVGMRKLFAYTRVLISFFSVLSMVLVKRWSVKLGVPDTTFAIAIAALLEFSTELYSIPMSIISMRLCPQGIESSMHSLLWSMQFVGLNISTYISAISMNLFGVYKGNFDGLVPLIVLFSTIRLVPILSVWMIPEEVPEDTIDQSELYVPISSRDSLE